MLIYRNIAVNLIKNNYFKINKRYLHQQLNFNNFTDVIVNVPHNVLIKPYLHPNCERISIKFQESNPGKTDIITKQIKDVIEITSSQAIKNDVCCELEIPIRANIKVLSQGDISVGHFHNSHLILNTNNGNVLVEKYYGKFLNIVNVDGNIQLGDIDSAEISAIILNKGFIKIKKVLAHECILNTKEGNIFIGASYCDNTKLSTDVGDMQLGNMHQNISLEIGSGNLIMTGFDGNLQADVKKGNADLHISRIRNSGQINIMEGNLLLKLSEEVQENTQINIEANAAHHLAPVLEKEKLKTKDNLLHATPMNLHESRKLFIKCKGDVNVKTASWVDSIMKQNIKT